MVDKHAVNTRRTHCSASYLLMHNTYSLISFGCEPSSPPEMQIDLMLTASVNLHRYKSTQ